MKYWFIAIAILSAGFASCKSKAFEYSQAIVKLETDLRPTLQSGEESMKVLFESKNYDSMAIVSGQMESAVDDKLQELKKMEVPAVEHGQKFKNAAVQYFEFLKSMYTTYKEFAKSTEEQRESERQKIVEMTGRFKKETEELQAVQKEYAKANGFRIESEKQ